MATDAPQLPPVAPDVGGSDGPGMPFGILREREPNVTIVRRPDGPSMPLGMRLEHDANVTIVRRPDRPPGAAFGAGGADPFEVEAVVLEDAD